MTYFRLGFGSCCALALAVACSGDDANIGSNEQTNGGETQETGGRENTGGTNPTGGRATTGGQATTGGNEPTGGTSPTGGASPGGEAGAPNGGSTQGGAGAGSGGNAGAAGGGSECDSVMHDGLLYRQLTVQEYCQARDCTVEGNERRDHFLCTDPEELFQNERRLGCGRIEIVSSASVWGETLYFDAETRQLIGAIHMGDIIADFVCESDSYVVGELPEEDCAEAEACNLCNAPRPSNGLPDCAPRECETVRYEGQTRRYESLEDYCAREGCPETLEEAEANESVCTDGGTLFRGSGCDLRSVTSWTESNETFYFDGEGALVGAAYTSNMTGQAVCESSSVAAGEVPATRCQDPVVCAICSGHPLADVVICD